MFLVFCSYKCVLLLTNECEVFFVCLLCFFFFVSCVCVFFGCVKAMYHFLSGYTAKVAGTERGVTEPTPNFSAGFGAAFLTLHPTA